MVADDRLVVAIMAYGDACMRQGRAIERGDQQEAAAAQRDAVVAFGQAMDIAELPEDIPVRPIRYTTGMNTGERVQVIRHTA